MPSLQPFEDIRKICNNCKTPNKLMVKLCSKCSFSDSFTRQPRFLWTAKNQNNKSVAEILAKLIDTEGYKSNDELLKYCQENVNPHMTLTNIKNAKPRHIIKLITRTVFNCGIIMANGVQCPFTASSGMEMSSHLQQSRHDCKNAQMRRREKKAKEQKIRFKNTKDLADYKLDDIVNLKKYRPEQIIRFTVTEWCKKMNITLIDIQKETWGINHFIELDDAFIVCNHNDDINDPNLPLLLFLPDYDEDKHYGNKYSYRYLFVRDAIRNILKTATTLFDRHGLKKFKNNEIFIVNVRVGIDRKWMLFVDYVQVGKSVARIFKYYLSRIRDSNSFLEPFALGCVNTNTKFNYGKMIYSCFNHESNEDLANIALTNKISETFNYIMDYFISCFGMKIYIKEYIRTWQAAKSQGINTGTISIVPILYGLWSAYEHARYWSMTRLIHCILPVVSVYGIVNTDFCGQILSLIAEYTIELNICEVSTEFGIEPLVNLDDLCKLYMHQLTIRKTAFAWKKYGYLFESKQGFKFDKNDIIAVTSFDSYYSHRTRKNVKLVVKTDLHGDGCTKVVKLDITLINIHNMFDKTPNNFKESKLTIFLKSKSVIVSNTLVDGTIRTQTLHEFLTQDDVDESTDEFDNDTKDDTKDDIKNDIKDDSKEESKEVSHKESNDEDMNLADNNNLGNFLYFKTLLFKYLTCCDQEFEKLNIDINDGLKGLNAYILPLDSIIDKLLETDTNNIYVFARLSKLLFSRIALSDYHVFNACKILLKRVMEVFPLDSADIISVLQNIISKDFAEVINNLFDQASALYIICSYIEFVTCEYNLDRSDVWIGVWNGMGHTIADKLYHYNTVHKGKELKKLIIDEYKKRNLYLQFQSENKSKFDQYQIKIDAAEDQFTYFCKELKFNIGSTGFTRWIHANPTDGQDPDVSAAGEGIRGLVIASETINIRNQ